MVLKNLKTKTKSSKEPRLLHYCMTQMLKVSPGIMRVLHHLQERACQNELASKLHLLYSGPTLLLNIFTFA